MTTHEASRLIPTHGTSKLVTTKESSATCCEGNGLSWRASFGTEDVTYWGLIRDNRPCRLYLASFVANYVGEWLTYISSLTALEAIQRNQGNNDNDNDQQTAISILIVVRLMTCVLASPFGGVLADRFDQRHVLIVLDLLGALVALLFVVAVFYESVALIYFATFAQNFLAGLYEPSHTAILPLLTENEASLEKVTVLTTILWSAVAAFGSAAGGFLVSRIGNQGCFLVDSFTFILSAAFLYAVGGNYRVSNGKNSDTVGNDPILSSCTMVSDGFRYLTGSFFAPLVLLKFTSLLLVPDVLNVAFSERDVDSTTGAVRLGVLFSAIGAGSFLAPIVAEQFTSMDHPESLQVACLVFFGITSTALLGMAIPDLPFVWVCLFASIRSGGISVVWTDSFLLIQKFCRPELLGRVTSIDFALAMIGESLSSVVAGIAHDEFGLSPSQVCLLLGLLGWAMMAGWILFHVTGGGAAFSFQSSTTRDACSVQIQNKLVGIPQEA